MGPYQWEAEYADGRRLRADSPGGPWREGTLPMPGLVALRIYGHPAGPLVIPRPDEWEPAGVVLRMRGVMTLGAATHHRRWLFGFRCGGLSHGWFIDPAGNASWRVGTLEDW